MSRNTNSVERQNTYVYMLRVKLVVIFVVKKCTGVAKAKK